MLIFALTGLTEVSRQEPRDELRHRSELYLNKAGVGVCGLLSQLFRTKRGSDYHIHRYCKQTKDATIDFFIAHIPYCHLSFRLSTFSPRKLIFDETLLQIN